MPKVKVALFVCVAVLAAALLLVSLLSHEAGETAAGRKRTGSAAEHRAPDKTPARAARARKMPKIIYSSPMTPADENRIAVTQRFLQEEDPEKRRYLVPELVDLKDPNSVLQILELLKTETDPQVRDNLIVFLGYMPYSTNYAEEIIAEARRLHAQPMDANDRLALQRMAIELQHPASAQFLRDVFNAPDTLPEERINAGEGLVRLHHEVGLVSKEEAASIVERMRLDAQAITDPAERAQAYRALNVTRFDNQEFFRQMLQTETDEDARRVLSAYVDASLRPSPTPGPLKTPWPSPAPYVDPTPTPEPTIPPGVPAEYVEPTPQYME